jgi:hypothetical protein
MHHHYPHRCPFSKVLMLAVDVSSQGPAIQVAALVGTPVRAVQAILGGAQLRGAAT